MELPPEPAADEVCIQQIGRFDHTGQRKDPPPALPLTFAPQMMPLLPSSALLRLPPSRAPPPPSRALAGAVSLPLVESSASSAEVQPPALQPLAPAVLLVTAAHLAAAPADCQAAADCLAAAAVSSLAAAVYYRVAAAATADHLDAANAAPSEVITSHLTAAAAAAPLARTAPATFNPASAGDGTANTAKLALSYYSGDHARHANGSDPISRAAGTPSCAADLPSSCGAVRLVLSCVYCSTPGAIAQGRYAQEAQI